MPARHLQVLTIISNETGSLTVCNVKFQFLQFITLPPALNDPRRGLAVRRPTQGTPESASPLPPFALRFLGEYTFVEPGI